MAVSRTSPRGRASWPNSPSFCQPPAKAAASRTRTTKSRSSPLGNRAVWRHSADRFPESRRRLAGHPGRSRPRTRNISTSNSRPTSPSWASRWSRGEQSGPTRSPRPCAGQARGRVCLRARCGPALHRWGVDRQGLCRGRAHRAAILALPVPGTLKRVRGDRTIEETVGTRGNLGRQTPQVFRRRLALGSVRQALRFRRHRRCCNSSSALARPSAW